MTVGPSVRAADIFQASHSSPVQNSECSVLPNMYTGLRTCLLSAIIGPHAPWNSEREKEKAESWKEYLIRAASHSSSAGTSCRGL
jgi:hypothetical protein